MGTEELRHEYEQLTGKAVKPASHSTGVPGPFWSLADWLLAGRNATSLFATGIGVLVIAASTAIVLLLVTPIIAKHGWPLILILAFYAMQGIAAIFILIALLTMLAGAIRVGTNADQQATDHKTPS